MKIPVQQRLQTKEIILKSDEASISFDGLKSGLVDGTRQNSKIARDACDVMFTVVLCRAIFVILKAVRFPRLIN